MHGSTEKHDQLKLLLSLISGRNLDTILSISFKGTSRICSISTVTDTSVKQDTIQACSHTATYPSFYWYSHSSSWNFFPSRNNDNNKKKKTYLTICPSCLTTSEFAQVAFADAQETACLPIHLSTHWLNMVLTFICCILGQSWGPLAWKEADQLLPTPDTFSEFSFITGYLVHTVSWSEMSALRETI